MTDPAGVWKKMCKMMEQQRNDALAENEKLREALQRATIGERGQKERNDDQQPEGTTDSIP